MGMSLCAEASKGERSNVHEFQFAQSWETSEELEDTHDDPGYFYRGKMGKLGKCISVPDQIGLEKAPTLKRAESDKVLRSKRYLFQEKRKDWHRSTVVKKEAELQAKRHSKIVMDDTLKHLSHSIRTAGSIVEKGAAINNELARQENVLSKAETDISIAEYDTDLVTNTLKGMRSLRGKLKNVIWKKEPKLKMNEFDCQTSTFSNVNLDLLEEDAGLCALSMQCKPSTIYRAAYEDEQQIQIKAGIKQLHKALNIMSVQQMEAAGALKSHEGRLSVFENQVTATNNKIKCQSHMIGKIMGKS